MTPQDQPKAVPLVELLRKVPKIARHREEDGQFSTSFYPVGRYCHEAAAEISRLTSELETSRLRQGLCKVKYFVTSLADAQVVALEALAQPSAPPAEQAAAVKGAERERATLQLIGERDERDRVIDAILDLVLGTDRAEWSSAYGFRDAVNDVGEFMAALAAEPSAKAAAARTSFNVGAWVESLTRVVNARGSTWKQVSDATGVSTTTLSRVRSGERAPDAASLAALSAWAGLNPASFFGEGVGLHPDDAAVDAFAVVMKEKLAQAREKGRGGWQTCPPEELSRMLREHVEKGDPRDVANFCMFLWSLGKSIATESAKAAVPMSIADAAKSFPNGPFHAPHITPAPQAQGARIAELEAKVKLREDKWEEEGNLRLKFQLRCSDLGAALTVAEDALSAIYDRHNAATMETARAALTTIRAAKGST